MGAAGGAEVDDLDARSLSCDFVVCGGDGDGNWISKWVRLDGWEETGQYIYLHHPYHIYQCVRIHFYLGVAEEDILGLEVAVDDVHLCHRRHFHFSSRESVCV